MQRRDQPGKTATLAIGKGASHLPETVRGAQITQVSVGGHPGVELTAQNDGGCRKDCRGEKITATKTTSEEKEDVLPASFRPRKKVNHLLHSGSNPFPLFVPQF